MHRTKWGCVLRRLAISLLRFSCIKPRTKKWWRTSFTLTYYVSHVSVNLKVVFTLCNCETVWKDAAFLFLCLVSAFGLPAATTATDSWKDNTFTYIYLFDQVLPLQFPVRSYPCRSWCSFQTGQPSVWWRISGTEPPPSHSEDLCFYPASLWCCMAPVDKYTQWGFFTTDNGTLTKNTCQWV